MPEHPPGALTRVDLPSGAQEARARALEGIATFAAKATVTPRHRRDKRRHLRGRLLVSPDAVVFTAQGVRFEHTEPTITLVKGSLLLKDKPTEVRVAVSIARRHRLKRALRQSDVKVAER
jgi:hypothetical protein